MWIVAEQMGRRRGGEDRDGKGYKLTMRTHGTQDMEPGGLWRSGRKMAVATSKGSPSSASRPSSRTEPKPTPDDSRPKRRGNHSSGASSLIPPNSPLNSAPRTNLFSPIPNIILPPYRVPGLRRLFYTPVACVIFIKLHLTVVRLSAPTLLAPCSSLSFSKAQDASFERKLSAPARNASEDRRGQLLIASGVCP